MLGLAQAPDCSRSLCLVVPNSSSLTSKDLGFLYIQRQMVPGCMLLSTISAEFFMSRILGVRAGSKLASHRQGPLQLLCEPKLLPQDLGLLLQIDFGASSAVVQAALEKSISHQKTVSLWQPQICALARVGCRRIGRTVPPQDRLR